MSPDVALIVDWFTNQTDESKQSQTCFWSKNLDILSWSSNSPPVDLYCPIHMCPEQSHGNPTGGATDFPQTWHHGGRDRSVREPEKRSLEATEVFFSKRDSDVSRDFHDLFPVFICVYTCYTYENYGQNPPFVDYSIYYPISYYVLTINVDDPWIIHPKKNRSIKKISMISYSTIYRWLFHIIPYYQRRFQFIYDSIDGNFIRDFGLGTLPIGSMYGIYANIWGILMVNVTIYSIHGSYGL